MKRVQKYLAVVAMAAGFNQTASAEVIPVYEIQNAKFFKSIFHFIIGF